MPPVDRYLHAPGRAKQRSHVHTPDPAIGARFGQWTVTGPTYGSKHRVTPVRCSCGVPALIRTSDLAAGRSVRCRGCADAAGRAKMLGQHAPKRMGMLPPKRPKP